MSYIAISIIILVIAMIVGPIMMVRPTVSQKRQAKLRKLALASGLSVSLTPNSIGQACMNYILPFAQDKDVPSWTLIRQSYHHEAHFFGFWDWGKDQKISDCKQGCELLSSRQNQILKESCAEVLPGVVAIGCNNTGIYLSWNEQLYGNTEEQVIDQILHWLEQLSGKLFKQ